MRIWLTSIFFVAWIGSAVAAPFTQDDTYKTASELFARHIEYSDFDPVIAKRTFQNALKRFDRAGLYILESEAKPYLNVNAETLHQVVLDFHKKKFTAYQPLHKLFIHSIKRARKIRTLIRSELLSDDILDLSEETRERWSGFADGEESLKLRLRQQMTGWLLDYANKKNVTSLNPELRLKVLNYYEQKRRAKEDPYLTSARNDDFYFHLFLAKSIACSLDAHTMVYSPKEAKELRYILSKVLCGVGLFLQEDIDGPIVQGFIPGSPVDLDGKIESGDRITHLDGHAVHGKSFKEVLQIMEGEEGSKLKITVVSTEGQVKELTYTREKIIMDHERLEVTHESYADGVIGKISFQSFYDNHEGVDLENDMRDALNSLKEMGPIYGLIIDLRQNLGGYLHQAVKIASLFIKEGVVVVAKYAGDEVRYTRDLDPRSFYNGPLVLLTSKASASAAEIVAQSLQDQGVAIVVGDERTYGKGSMQIQTLTDEFAEYFYKVTIGRYYTSSGKSTQIDGVEADLVVPTQYAPFRIGERYLNFPIPSDKLFNQMQASAHADIKMVLSLHQKKAPTLWERMIPRLKSNSQLRINEDVNFQAFQTFVEEKKKNITSDPDRVYGSEDLQMKEAVNIVKDMAQMVPLQSF